MGGEGEAMCTGGGEVGKYPARQLAKARQNRFISRTSLNGG